MMHPTFYPSDLDIAVRLGLTFIAGALVGLNRETRGHAAGLRTTLLVCLAASVAMIQMDLLLPMAGKSSDSFAVLDLMRLPLGILTGVGFIGGGAILKKGSLVLGVTTASTLWIVTVIGLCFGGGQLGLGSIATILALFILWGMKLVDARLPRVRRGVISITEKQEEAPSDTLDGAFAIANPRLLDRNWDKDHGYRISRYEIRFKGPESVLLKTLESTVRAPTTVNVQWTAAEG